MYIFVKYKVFILVKLIIAFEYLKIIILEFIIQKQAKNYHAKKKQHSKKITLFIYAFKLYNATGP